MEYRDMDWAVFVLSSMVPKYCDLLEPHVRGKELVALNMVYYHHHYGTHKDDVQFNFFD